MMKSDLNNLYGLNTFDDATTIVLQHPSNIHDNLVGLIENVLDKPFHQTRNKLFMTTTYFSNGYVNTGNEMNSNGLYTHSVFFQSLSEEKVAQLDLQFKSHYLPDVEKFRLENKSLFE